jgi:hypothetical protein
MFDLHKQAPVAPLNGDEKPRYNAFHAKRQKWKREFAEASAESIRMSRQRPLNYRMHT